MNVKEKNEVIVARKIIESFLEAVYPGNSHMAVASFNELAALEDATIEINQLRNTASEYLKKNLELCAELENVARCSSQSVAETGHASPADFATAVSAAVKVVPRAMLERAYEAGFLAAHDGGVTPYDHKENAKRNNYEITE